MVGCRDRRRIEWGKSEWKHADTSTNSCLAVISNTSAHYHTATHSKFGLNGRRVVAKGKRHRVVASRRSPNTGPFRVETSSLWICIKWNQVLYARLLEQEQRELTGPFMFHVGLVRGVGRWGEGKVARIKHIVFVTITTSSSSMKTSRSCLRFF